MLKYTGHPLVDVGVAAITAFVNKREPSELTNEDLEKVVDYMKREYVKSPLDSYLTVCFPNSGFTQSAFKDKPERKEAYARLVLESYREDLPSLDEKCVFTGEAAIAIPFGEALPAGRAFRQHIPLVTAQGVINFHPYGQAGLPVSGQALLAIQAFPLGAAKCDGRPLIVHSDNLRLIHYFADSFQKETRRAVQMAQLADSKMPEPHLSSRSLLIKTLLDGAEMQKEEREEEELFSLTAYHLSNSGQGPSLDIYHLPLQMIGFLRDMQQARYKQEWKVIVGRAWEVPPPEKKDEKGKKGKKGKKDKKSEPFQPKRNWLYEDLFKLPQNAGRFLRTYLLREALQYALAKGDPAVNYSLKNEVELVSWKITERFLWRVMNMDKERIAQIRAMGDRLAEYVSGENDKRFFRTFFVEQRYAYFRTALIKANLASVRRGYAPLIRLDPYLEVFEDGEELARGDWRLARDLLLIRMVEQLYDQGWLGSNADAIPDSNDEDESETE